jgi:hypothetical protein
MTFTPIPRGTTNWDVPVNAAFAQLDSNITANQGTALQAANNLSDLTNTAQARINLGLTGLANAKSNMNALTNPTVNSDNTQGYSIGSTWFNTSTNAMYVATNVATGAAVWLQIPPTFVDLTSAQTVAGNKNFTGLTSFSNASTSTPVVTATSTANGGVGVRVVSNQAADVAYSARVTGDTLSRLIVGADGSLKWSAGSGSSDTTAGRAAAGVLYAGQNLLVGSTTALGDNGVGEIQIANATTVPTTNPTGGTLLYSNAGSLNLRNAQGLVKAFAGAIPGSNVVTTVANTVTETTVATLTVPANDMAVGGLYRIKAWGIASTTGTPTIRFRAFVGATQIASTGTLTPTTAAWANKAWSIESYFTVISTGSSGSIMGHLDFPNAATATNTGNPSLITGTVQDGGAAVTMNTTISEAFTIQFTWGTASASNTLTCFGVIAEKVT